MTLPDPCLFESVLSALIEKFHPFIEEEMANCAEAISQRESTQILSFLVERFETFPRSVGLYSQMIITLGNVATYDRVTVLVFLSRLLMTILSGNPAKTFEGLDKMVNHDYIFSDNFIWAIELILVTDTVCNIVTSMTEMDSETADALTKAAVSICEVKPEQRDLAIFLLNQWSVTMSFVSKLAPNVIVDNITQMEIDGSDLFFVMMRYLRLDVDQKHGQGLVDIVWDRVIWNVRRKVVTSSMLISLSTFFMTYQGDPTFLNEFFDLANTLCEKPEENPGAVELVSTLLPKMNGVTKEMIYKFYEEKVYPLTRVKEGMKSAVRALRMLMYGKDIEPDFLFWNWGPSHRANSFDFVNWNGAETRDQYAEGSFGQIFMKYYITSPHFDMCPHLIRDVLVHLAALDFKFFTDVIYKHFTETCKTDMFKCFLNAVPMINNPEFVERTHLAREIEEFNGNLGAFTGRHLRKIIGKLDDCQYGFPSDRYEEYRKALEKATQAIEALRVSWGISFGEAYNEQITQRGASNQGKLGQPGRIVKIIPYVINSQMFEEEKWTDYLIKLAALSDVTVSKPAYSICQSLLQQPKRHMLLVKCAVNFIIGCQHPAIVCTCLKLLLEAIEEMEPETPSEIDAVQYSVEFAAFLSLACAHPIVRSVGYELFVKTNKLLQNQGLFSRVEMQFSAISSNVKHNIFLQKFPKRPGHPKYPDDELALSNALNSRYQMPWLFFLAELGRVAVSANYAPILSGIHKSCHEFSKKRSRDFDLGLLVLFFATCTSQSHIDKSFHFYEIPVATNTIVTSFEQDLSTAVASIMASRRRDLINVLVTAMKHANYTIVPMLLRQLATCLLPFSLEWLPSLYMILCSIEANNVLKQAVFSHVGALLMPCIERFKWCKITLATLSTDMEDILLSFLTCVVLWLDVDDYGPELSKWSSTSGWKMFTFVASWSFPSTKQKPVRNLDSVHLYAAAALESILSTGPVFQNAPNFAIPKDGTIRSLAKCNRRGYDVLKPLLQNNRKFLDTFISNCFNRKPAGADFFFDAIYHVVKYNHELLRSKQSCSSDLWRKWAGSLFLLGLFRLKTGSLLASDFLKEFILFYAELIGYTDDLTEDLENQPIDAVPVMHFMAVAEDVVAAALEQMTNEKFRGTVKVLVDIVTPWLGLFRMLPGQGTCVPGLETVIGRRTPKYFLDMLMQITEKKKDEHDFQRMVDLWATLLSIPDHRVFVPVFILECQDVVTRRMLMDKLLPTFPVLIIELLAERCKFAYFAYVSYQMSKDFEQAIWFVPVIMRALKHNMDQCVRELYRFIHFALLFHANQTQSLLKRLCKCLNIPYSRRTLSAGSVREIVKVFQERLTEPDRLRSLTPPRPVTPESSPESDYEGEDLENDEKKHKIQDPIKEWAREAMRWAIGCKNLKIAHLSLVILNALDGYQHKLPFEEQQDLLRGLCKSAANFLSTCEPKDSLTFDYINETFRVFQTHFVGNEEFALEYIRAYLSFVVSVDAYLDQMIPLYKMCRESLKTRDEALKDLLPALQSSFNELELNSQAHKAFIEFWTDLENSVASETSNPWSVDLNFVKAALERTDRSFRNEGDEELIKNATGEQRNRALYHYSLMVQTASIDLKKRIFVLSSMILVQTEEERKHSQKVDHARSHVRHHDELPPTSTRDVISRESGISPRISEERVGVDGNTMSARDLNTQALVVIFNAAVQMLPSMRQAVEFMKVLSAIDPLIATVPIIDEMDWKEDVTKVVTKLTEYGIQENANVSLTDCTNLASVSNLLNDGIEPKILPYNSQRDLLQSVLHVPERGGKSHGVAVPRIPSASRHDIHRTLSERMSPRAVVTQRRFDRLPLPEALLTDEILVTNDGIKDMAVDLDYVCGSLDAFRALSE